jgi:hypothetical protein
MFIHGWSSVGGESEGLGVKRRQAELLNAFNNCSIKGEEEIVKEGEGE